jgi:hypothetical protein
MALRNPSAVSLGDDDGVPIKAMPPGVVCSMPEDNEDLSLTGALTEEAGECSMTCVILLESWRLHTRPPFRGRYTLR